MSTSAVLSRVVARVRTLPRGYLFVFIALISTSIASPLTKAALTAQPAPMAILSARLIIAAVVLWLVMALVFRQRPVLERRLLIGGLAAGILNSISLSAFYIGLTQIDTSIALVLFTVHPLVVLGILALLGTRPTWMDGARGLLALTGVILLVGVSGQVAMGGVAWILVTVVVYSVHLVVVQRVLKGYSAIQVTPVFITVMAVCVTGVYWLTAPANDTLYNFGPEVWAVVAITAIVSTVVARLALTAGIRHIGSAQTALLTPIETLLATGLATIFLGERLSAIQLVGGALVLVSAVLVLRRPAVSNIEAQAPEPGV